MGKLVTATESEVRYQTSEAEALGNGGTGTLNSNSCLFTLFLLGCTVGGYELERIRYVSVCGLRRVKEEH